MVGAAPLTLEPRIAVTACDRAEAAEVLPETSASFIALHVGASDPQRRWHADAFSSLGDTFAERGYRVILVGDESERRIVDEVAEGMHHDPVNLVGAVTLGGLAGVFDRCRLLVANDSGPLHLAHAVGTPTVGLYLCFNALTAVILGRSNHRPLISWRITCPVCGVDRTTQHCSHLPSFVDGISIEEVLCASSELLQAPVDSS